MVFQLSTSRIFKIIKNVFFAWMHFDFWHSKCWREPHKATSYYQAGLDVDRYLESHLRGPSDRSVHPSVTLHFLMSIFCLRKCHRIVSFDPASPSLSPSFWFSYSSSSSFLVPEMNAAELHHTMSTTVVPPKQFQPIFAYATGNYLTQRYLLSYLVLTYLPLY